MEGTIVYHHDGISHDTQTFDAYLNGSTDTDSYYFAGDTGWNGSYTFTVGDFGSTAVDPVVGVYDDSGNMLGFDNDGGPGDDARLTLTLSPQTRYIVAVADTHGGTGDLELTVRASGDTTPTVVAIGPDGAGSRRGQFISPNTDSDFYRMTSPPAANGSLDVTVTPTSPLDVEVYLMDSAGNELDSADRRGGRHRDAHV